MIRPAMKSAFDRLGEVPVDIGRSSRWLRKLSPVSSKRFWSALRLGHLSLEFFPARLVRHLCPLLGRRTSPLSKTETHASEGSSMVRYLSASPF